MRGTYFIKNPRLSVYLLCRWDTAYENVTKSVGRNSWSIYLQGVLFQKNKWDCATRDRTHLLWCHSPARWPPRHKSSPPNRFEEKLIDRYNHCWLFHAKSILYIRTVLFQTIQLNISTQLSSTKLIDRTLDITNAKSILYIRTVLFQTIHFSISTQLSST